MSEDIKRIKPDINLNLTEDETMFLFRNLLRYEGGMENFKGCNFSNKKLQDFIKDKGIDLPHNTKKKKLNISEYSKLNQIQFISHGNVCYNLSKRLRDAFAHGLIEKDEKTGVIHFQDYNCGKFTADGHIEFSLLKELFEEILRTKEQ